MDRTWSDGATERTSIEQKRKWDPNKKFNLAAIQSHECQKPPLSNSKRHKTKKNDRTQNVRPFIIKMLIRKVSWSQNHVRAVYKYIGHRKEGNLESGMTSSNTSIKNSRNQIEHNLVRSQYLNRFWVRIKRGQRTSPDSPSQHGQFERSIRNFCAIFLDWPALTGLKLV